MRRLVLIGVLSLTLCVLAWPSHAQMELDVMSFNLRYGTALDGANSWTRRCGLVTKVIADYSPDIVGTQECLAFQAEHIAAELPEYRWFGVGREANGKGEHSAILYKHAVVEPLETGNFWLSETPEAPGSKSWNTACTRMVTWGKFYHFETKRCFYAFNTHLDHRSEEARVGGAKLLAERIPAIAGDLPVMVTGDFNAVAGRSEAWKELTGSGLVDAYDVAAETAGPKSTWCGFEKPDESGRRIDWVLCGGAVTVGRCEVVGYNQDGRYPSDHLPVVATVSAGE
ncbi:MAG: endonuclease/exonuclease/phosphatase family protein [bacterium]|nr:endonuclease/exonuclease/phosphatase family protein [bacterium]